MKLIPVETGRKSMTQTIGNSLHTIPNKRLSVQVSLTGLSFLLTNSSKSEVIHFSSIVYQKERTPEELLLDIDNFIKEHVSEPSEFESVNVIYSNAEYTAVPSPLFDEAKASDYLKFNAKILANDFIAWDEVTSRNLHIVYVPYVNINNFLFDIFGSFQYFHSASVMLEMIPPGSRFTEEASVYINVERTNFQIVIQSASELMLCNSYHFVTPEDFIYYILFCFEQLEINPDSAKVVMMGQIKKEDPLYEIAYTYIRNIEFLPEGAALMALDETLAHEHALLKYI